MEQIMENKLAAKDMAMIAVSAILIAICSWITIPGAVPFTLQTFAVCAVTAILGTRRGEFAIVLYLLLGAVGLPVFSGFSGGIGRLLGTTGGYIIGFIAVPLLYGLVTKAGGTKILPTALGLLLGDVIVFIFGTAWFMIVYANTKGAVTLGQALGWCVIPFIIPDLVKIVLAALVADRVKKAGVV